MVTVLHPGDTPSRPLRVPGPVLEVRGRTLVLVAGIPGAGKSTLLATWAADPDRAVLDSQDARAALGALGRAGVPYRVLRPLVHLRHRLAVVAAALTGPRDVVVHLPATAPGLRRVVRALALLTGRRPHLVWLDVTPQEALAGQRARGRTVRAAAFDRHARAAAAARQSVRTEPWASVTVLDRAAARRGLHLRPSAQ